MKLDAIKAFIRTRPLSTVFVGAMLGALVAVILASCSPGSARVSLAFTIAEQQRQDTPDYSYDGYYSIRASELVADSLMSWLSTPSVIKDIYTSAGLPITDAQAFAKAGRAFRAKKDLKKRWESLSYTARREYAEALTGAKKSETRERRLAVIVKALAKRPKPG